MTKSYVRILTKEEAISRGVDFSKRPRPYDSYYIFSEDSRREFQGTIAELTDRLYDGSPILYIRKSTAIVLDPRLYDVLDISSISEEKKIISTSLFEILKSQNGEIVKYIIRKLFDEKEFEVFDFKLEKKGMMSYKTKGHSKRQPIKIGRGINKILNLLGAKNIFSSSQIEILTNTLKAFSLGTKGFNTIKGKNILAYYHENSYDWNMNIGSLGKSCMRNSECQKYLQFYVDNSDICELLVYSNPKGTKGRITARALLWKLNSGEVFMDRVYGDDATQSLFIQYAKEKGYLYKKVQSFTDKELVIVNGEVETKEMKIRLNKPLSSYKYYPYLDTFTYDAGDSEMVNVDTYVTIGKFDDIRGSYKKFKTCYASKKKTFEDLYTYIDEDGVNRKCLGEFAGETKRGYYVNKLTAKKLLSGYWAYEKDVVFLKKQNGWEYEEDTFECKYDNHIYSMYINNEGSSIRAYRETRIGKVHIMNYHFLSDEDKKVQQKEVISDLYLAGTDIAMIDETRSYLRTSQLSWTQPVPTSDTVF